MVVRQLAHQFQRLHMLPHAPFSAPNRQPVSHIVTRTPTTLPTCDCVSALPPTGACLSVLASRLALCVMENPRLSIPLSLTTRARRDELRCSMHTASPTCARAQKQARLMVAFSQAANAGREGGWTDGMGWCAQSMVLNTHCGRLGGPAICCQWVCFLFLAKLSICPSSYTTNYRYWSKCDR